MNLGLDTRVRLMEMTPRECAQLFHDWAFWARPDQAPPDGDWIIWLILAGRGAGKTRAGAEAVRTWVNTYPIVNLIGATIADARDIMVKGEFGILACCRRDERPRFLAADLRLEWPNGAVSSLFSAEEPEGGAVCRNCRGDAGGPVVAPPSVNALRRKRRPRNSPKS